MNVTLNDVKVLFVMKNDLVIVDNVVETTKRKVDNTFSLLGGVGHLFACGVTIQGSDR